MGTVTTTTVAPAGKPVRRSIFGRLLGLADNGSFVSFGNTTRSPCVGASIAVTDETSNVRTVTITLRDANGAAIDYTQAVQIFVFTDATRTAKATGGSTGLAISTAGLLYTHTAKLHFTAVSDAAGSIVLTWTDTGTESVSVAIKLPSQVWVTSAAFANT